MDIKNGHYLRVYVGGVAVGKSTECSYSLSSEMKAVSHKDTPGDGSGFKEVRPGEKSGTMTTSAFFAEGDSYGTLFSAWKAGTELDVMFSDEISGGNKLTSKAYISGLEKNAPNNELVTYSVNFELSGEISLAAI